MTRTASAGHAAQNPNMNPQSPQENTKKTGKKKLQFLSGIKGRQSAPPQSCYYREGNQIRAAPDFHTGKGRKELPQKTSAGGEEEKTACVPRDLVSRYSRLRGRIPHP